MLKVPFIKHVAWYLVVAMFILGIAPRVDAGFAPSGIIDLKPEHRAADIERIQSVLETKAVRERLSQFGLNQDEIAGRLSQLSDKQIHQLALQLDDLRVGQDAGGVIIAVLVIIILIIVILQLTGHKIIVTK
jgi:hypothetical protein